MKPIIEVRDLSKSFLISHEKREKYTALRDVMAEKAKRVFSFPFRLRKMGQTREEFWALQDVSFTVEQGERVGIIGRNGAGKSTLLKVLSRITEPTRGEVRIRGRVASLLEVGTGFHPELTGRENIFLNGAILGMTREEIRRKFDEIVEFAEVERFLDTPVKRYSSGMYVRLAFAVAAHLEPDILVVDEVLAVGDAQFQRKCLGKMDDVSKKEGRTVLFVSHNMSAMKYLCSKAILLENGSVRKIDQVSRVIEEYNSTSGLTPLSVTNLEKWSVHSVSVYQGGLKASSVDITEEINLQIVFSTTEPGKISFELSIKDSEYDPILFLPLGLAQNINYHCDAGTYEVRVKLKLPQLAIGVYHVDLFIVESFVKRLGSFFNVLTFEVSSSYIPSTGWNFQKLPETGSVLHEVIAVDLVPQSSSAIINHSQ